VVRSRYHDRGSSHCWGHADSRIDRRHGRDAGSEAQCGGSASASRTISANNKVTRVVTPVGDSLPDFHAPPAVPRSTFCSRGRELKQGIGRAAGETLNDSAQMFPMLTTGPILGRAPAAPIWVDYLLRSRAAVTLSSRLSGNRLKQKLRRGISSGLGARSRSRAASAKADARGAQAKCLVRQQDTAPEMSVTLGLAGS
jgi:hypothetical protein